MNKISKLIILIFNLFFCNRLSCMQERNLLRTTGLPIDIQKIISSYVFKYFNLDSSDKSAQDWQKNISYLEITNKDQINCVCISSDNTILISTSDYVVKFWNIKNNKELKKISFPKKINSIAISKDNKYLAAFFSDYCFSIYDNINEKIKCQNVVTSSKINSAKYFLRSISFLEDNSLLIQFNYKNSNIIINQLFNILKLNFEKPKDIKVDNNWNFVGSNIFLEEDQPIAIFDNFCAWSDNGDILILDHRKYLDHLKKIYNSTNASRRGFLATILTKIDNAHKKIISSLAFSPNGQYLVSTCQDGSIKIWFNKYLCLVE